MYYHYFNTDEPPIIGTYKVGTGPGYPFAAEVKRNYTYPTKMRKAQRRLATWYHQGGTLRKKQTWLEKSKAGKAVRDLKPFDVPGEPIDPLSKVMW